MKRNLQLAELDLRILRVLQSDANLSHADLAAEVGSSAASCWRRLKVLEQEGILAGAVRLLDAERMGFRVHIFCHVRLRSHAAVDTAAFEQLVERLPEVLECYSMSGDWDYLLRVVAVDVSSYEMFLRDRLLNHSSVAAASSHFALSQKKFTTALPI